METLFELISPAGAALLAIGVPLVSALIIVVLMSAGAVVTAVGLYRTR